MNSKIIEKKMEIENNLDEMSQLKHKESRMLKILENIQMLLKRNEEEFEHLIDELRQMEDQDKKITLIKGDENGR